MNPTETAVIDDIFRCLFCKTKFTGVIKLVPECGSSICESCHLELRDEMNKFNEYVCRECNKWHTMPTTGLYENKALSRMMASMTKSEPQPRNEKADFMKTLMDEVHDKIDKLKRFNVEEEIEAHCQGLVKKVLEAIDVGLKHLSNLGNELLEHISKYRTRLFNSIADSEFQVSNDALQHDLDMLANEFKDFSSASSHAFSFSNDAFLKSILSSINEYKSRVTNMEKKITKKAFHGWIMGFRPNEAFCKMKDHLGEMYYEPIITSELPLAIPHSQSSNDDISSQATISEDSSTILHILAGHTDKVRQVIFLPGGNLASCSDDRIIKVWDPSTGQMLYQLVGALNKILAMASLSENLLACNSGRVIYVWNLSEQKCVKKLRGHEDNIITLSVLGNGNLVSIAYDDTIRIWNPHQLGDGLVKTLHGHGIKDFIQMGILPNNQLVTCSTILSSTQGEEYLKIWNLESPEGQEVRSISIGAGKPSAMAVLPDDQVAIGFYTGSIRIVNMNQIEKSINLFCCHTKGVFSLLATSDGHLLSGGSRMDSTIKVWDPSNGLLIRKIHTGHGYNVCSMSISKDGRYLATGSFDNSAKIIAFN